MSEPTPPSRLPVPIERAAMERVLARAAELQARSADAPETLTEEQLLEIGREVGLPVEHIRQALAEERTRVVVEPETGLAARVAGPAHAVASRVVDGTPAEVLAALDEWLRREECLQVKRRQGDRLTWEPRRDMVAAIRREFRLGGRGYALARATEVGATATAVDERRVLVRLDADLTGGRMSRLRAGGAVAGLGIAGGTAPLALAAALPDPTIAAIVLAAGSGLAAAVAGLGGGWAVARGHRAQIARAQLALDQLLDRLEHGETPPRQPALLDVIAKAGQLGRRR